MKLTTDMWFLVKLFSAFFVIGVVIVLYIIPADKKLAQIIKDLRQ